MIILETVDTKEELSLKLGTAIRYAIKQLKT